MKLRISSMELVGLTPRTFRIVTPGMCHNLNFMKVDQKQKGERKIVGNYDPVDLVTS